MVAIERLYTERIDEQVDRLAHHAVRGELWGEAVKYLHRTGSRDVERSAYRGAQTSFEQALVSLRHLPETEENIARAIDIRLEFRTALFASGNAARIEEILKEAQQLARILDDPSRLGQITNFQLISAYWSSDYERAMDAAREAGPHEDIGIQVVRHQITGLSAQALGLHSQAIVLFRKSIASLQGALIRERFGQLLIPAVVGRVGLANILTEIGLFDEVIEIATEGLEIGQSPDHPASVVVSLSSLGRAYLGKGNVFKALPSLQRALQVCRDLQLPWFQEVTLRSGLPISWMGRFPLRTS